MKQVGWQNVFPENKVESVLSIKLKGIPSILNKHYLSSEAISNGLQARLDLHINYHVSKGNVKYEKEKYYLIR